MPAAHTIHGIDINNIAKINGCNMFGSNGNAGVPVSVGTIPLVHVFDRFTDANSTILSNHTPDIDETATGWSATAAGIFNNNLSIGMAEGDPLIDPGVADCFVSWINTPAYNGTTDRGRIYMNWASDVAHWEIQIKYNSATTGGLYIYEDDAGLTVRASDTTFNIADFVANSVLIGVTSGDTIACAAYSVSGTLISDVSYNVASRPFKTNTSVGVNNAHQSDNFICSNRNVTSFV